MKARSRRMVPDESLSPRFFSIFNGKAKKAYVLQTIVDHFQLGACQNVSYRKLDIWVALPKAPHQVRDDLKTDSGYKAHTNMTKLAF